MTEEQTGPELLRQAAALMLTAANEWEADGRPSDELIARTLAGITALEQAADRLGL